MAKPEYPNLDQKICGQKESILRKLDSIKSPSLSSVEKKAFNSIVLPAIISTYQDQPEKVMKCLHYINVGLARKKSMSEIADVLCPSLDISYFSDTATYKQLAFNEDYML